MELSSSQKQAFEKIKSWLKNKGKQVFVLTGYAGTGKTFLIDYLTKELELKNVAFCTPTGKATTILIQKGLESQTIHRLIYNVIELPDNTIKFTLKDSIGDYDLIVLDEASMVNDDILDDLKSFNIPILAVGDHGQLPPVQGVNSLLQNIDYKLEEIIRQAKDSPIIDLADFVRQGGNIYDYPRKNESNGIINVINQSELTVDKLKELVETHDQVICGSNRTRKSMNHWIRNLKGFTFIYPMVDDKIIITRNNYNIVSDDLPFINGLIGFTKMNYLAKDYGVMHLEVDKHMFYNICYKTEVFDNKVYDKNLRYALNGVRTGYNKFALVLNEIDFGYAITCHKSQGSEFDNLLVIDESNIFGNEKYRWLYTAVTRARKKITIIV